MVDQIPTGAVWNFDTWLEGTNILFESGSGGPRVMTFTANAAITAGQIVDMQTGSVVQPAADSSTTTQGIATETAASGAHVPIMMEGLARGVTASGAITAGVRVIAAGAPAGSVKSGTTAGQVIGTALTVATTTGGTILLFVHH